MGDAVFVTDLEGGNAGKIIEVNPAAEKQTGYTYKELVDMNIATDLAIEDTIELSRIALDNSLLKGESVTTSEKKKRKDGSTYWVEIMLTPFDYAGKKACLSINRDITKRKKAEEALRESEEKFRSIIKSMDDMVFVLDKDDVFISVNADNKDLMLKPEMFIGKKHCNVVPKHVDELYNRAMINIRKGETEEYEYDLKTPNGIRWFGLKISPVLHNNKFHGSVSVVRDITESKQIQEQIAKELEIKRNLLKELYHRTKNNMQLISSMLRMQSRNSDDKYIQDSFLEVINKIKSMSLVHQKLYQAQDLSRINLRDYVMDLTSFLMQSYNIHTNKIAINIQVKNILVQIDTAIPLGLVLNELISNVFKHAFPDKKIGEINIQLFKEDSETITIILSDNGVGFPKDMDLKNLKTMGINTLYTLVELQLKGEISYESNNGLSWKIKRKDNVNAIRV